MPAGWCDCSRVGTSCLSSADYRFNEALTRAAIEARVHLCDLGGNLFVVEKQLAMDADAKRAGIIVVPDCGLAPGMACLLAAWGVERMDSAESVKIRVGGLPAHPKPPLNYKLVFSVRGLTNEYLEPAEVLRDGNIVRVPVAHRAGGRRVSLSVRHPGGFQHLGGRFHAAAHAQGPRAKPRLQDHPLSWASGGVLPGCTPLGCCPRTPVDGVVPRAFTEKLIERSLSDDDTDVVLVRVSIDGKSSGKRSRLTLEIIDRQEPKTGHSAMARTTAYPAAAVAYMMAAGAVERRGVLPGELAVPLEAFVQAVKTRGIDVRERWD